MTKEEALNELIKGSDTNKISDGYHTFEQLYEHRIVLYIAFARLLGFTADPACCTWCSKKHSDGSEWDGWFLLGIGITFGKQITYHLPIKYWDGVAIDTETEYGLYGFAEVLDTAPEFDGHTSEDVLKRISQF